MPQVDPLRITSDAAYMAELRKSQQWDIINHYLEILGDDHTALLQNGWQIPVEQIRYYQGILAGLRMAQMIPENILAWAKQVAGESKKLDKLTLA